LVVVVGKFFRWFTYLFIMSLTLQVYGQSTQIAGIVRNKEGQALAGASVSIGDSFATQVTDAAGKFSFKGIPPGNYTLKISHVGYAPYTETVLLENQLRNIVVRLDTESRMLDDVIVTGKTETQQVREQAIRAVVVDTRAAAEQPATLAELMNRSPGIRIRQSGGLGSQTDISMNGFQGRAVRYFRDGIPMNYLGEGFSLNNVPVDMLERVEVYKGALPIYLGADALGGGVNLVTKPFETNRLSFSYEVGSFNTHRVAINSYLTNNQKSIFGGIDAFFNYTDNNYNAYVMVTDPETRNQTEKSVELFHNAYKNYYTEGYIGIRDQPWAKELRLSLAYFNTNREQQHPALMTDPYGALESKQSSLIPSIRYKHSLLDDRLEIEQFFVVNTLNAGVIDTVKGYYDWYGNFYSAPNRMGESGRPSLSDVAINQFVSRTLISYHLNGNNTIRANFVYTDSKRKGEDPYGPRFEGTDQDALSVPAIYRKSVAALGWESTFLAKKLAYSLTGKWYNYTSKGVETWAARPANIDEMVTAQQDYFGISTALKYDISPDIFTRASAEYAYRLPDFGELFGDAIWIVPSFKLKPERSLNLNSGAAVQKEKFTAEINGFYRETKDLILLITNIPPYSQYQNINNVRGYGIELDGRWDIHRFLRATANATWQSLRLFGFTVPGDLWRNGTRLQNTPYFFANAGLVSSVKPNIFPGDFLQVYANYNFVREFYLQTIARESEPGGFLGLGGSADVNSAVIIPNQSLVNIGFTYKPIGDKLAIGFESKNILDERQYDYFRVQKAGRSFYAKISYLIH